MLMNKRVFFLMVLTAITPVVAAPAVYQITAEQWAMPRHGERLLQFPAIRAVLQEWDQNPDLKIEISYPGGETGELWVQEMKDWLIALGISSGNIQTLAGSSASDILELSAVRAGGNKQ